MSQNVMLSIAAVLSLGLLPAIASNQTSNQTSASPVKAQLRQVAFSAPNENSSGKNSVSIQSPEGHAMHMQMMQMQAMQQNFQGQQAKKMPESNAKENSTKK